MTTSHLSDAVTAIPKVEDARLAESLASTQNAIPSRDGLAIIKADESAHAAAATTLPDLQIVHTETAKPTSSTLKDFAVTEAVGAGAGAAGEATIMGVGGRFLGSVLASLIPHEADFVAQIALRSAGVGAVVGASEGAAVAAAGFGSYEALKYIYNHPEYAPNPAFVS